MSNADVLSMSYLACISVVERGSIRTNSRRHLGRGCNALQPVTTLSQRRDYLLGNQEVLTYVRRAVSIRVKLK